jgi:RNA polymerase sigma-70 factor (sigma-E family)
VRACGVDRPDLRARRAVRRALERAIVDALDTACHPRPVLGTSVGAMAVTMPIWMTDGSIISEPAPTRVGAHAESTIDVDALGVPLFRQEASSLVRLARLFVDDRNAAEDLVQEAFIRLARNAHRLRDLEKAPAYLRSIVLNLARDSNRRGLVSLRHHLPSDEQASVDDQITLREDQQRVIDALRELPHRQRECIVLRYYDELGIDDIATTLDISRNSVKTHLSRGLDGLEQKLAAPLDLDPDTDADAIAGVIA